MAILVKHNKVSTVPDDADTSLVRPSDWNADHTLTGFGTAAELDAGVANGVATLDAGGKVPQTQIPLMGDLNYQGTWNASTNSPTLTSSVGTKGYYYVVDVAGSTDLNGITDWKIGDWAIFNGTIWQKVDNTDAVTSVNGQVGTVVLTAADVGAQPAGTYVTSVGATSPVTSSGGTTPTIAMPAANSTTNGYLTSTDWNTFNTISTGGVVGPASATDNAITRFDGTTGKLVQNSTVTLDDNGNIINANSLGLDTTPATVPTTVGTMSWDDGDGVPIVSLKGGNVNLQVGTQELARVYNDSGTTLTKGQVVYISGSQGNRVAVKLARADVEATSFGTIGLVAETMTSGAEGFIIVSGALYKLDTTGLVAGSTVYLSPTTAGAVTTTKPQAPDQLVVVGWVERVDNIVGSIYVKIDNGYELDELHDVRITSPQSGNVLIYDATTTPTGVWKNANLTDGTGISITEGAGSVTVTNTGVTALSAGTGISVSGSTGSVTVTNTAPDQTVSLTGGTGISTSGTYPNFTITNTAPDQTVSLTGAGTTSVTGTYPNFTITSNDQFTGTVTSVAALTLGTTGTDLSSSVANPTTTPVITLNVPTASATNRGALSSTDWTTFNNKANAFTYTTNYVPFGQGTTTPNQSINFTYTTGTGSLRSPQVEASNGLILNNLTIATTFSIPSGYGASSVGPVTVNSGVTVTVPSGSRWVVL